VGVGGGWGVGNHCGPTLLIHTLPEPTRFPAIRGNPACSIGRWAQACDHRGPAWLAGTSPISVRPTGAEVELLAPQKFFLALRNEKCRPATRGSFKRADRSGADQASADSKSSPAFVPVSRTGEIQRRLDRSSAIAVIKSRYLKRILPYVVFDSRPFSRIRAVLRGVWRENKRRSPLVFGPPKNMSYEIGVIGRRVRIGPARQARDTG